MILSRVSKFEAYTTLDTFTWNKMSTAHRRDAQSFRVIRHRETSNASPANPAVLR